MTRPVTSSGAHPVAPARPYRLLIDPLREPRRNLAREEALARTRPVPTLRLWRNDRCVVLGRFQVTGGEVDERACRHLGVPVYRRFTGGGTVYQDAGNLNVTLVAPRDASPFRARPERLSVPGLYEVVLRPLAAAVRSLGILGQAGEREVVVHGRKVSGVAAWLGAGSVLVHATLLIDPDLGALHRVLDGPGDPGNQRWLHTRSHRVPVTSLVREGLSANRRGAVEAAVVDAFDALLLAEEGQGPGLAAQSSGAGATRLEPGRPTPTELSAESRLLAERYGRAAWHASGQAGGGGDGDGRIAP